MKATSTLLPAFAGAPTDVNALIQGINKRGEVLGYSFTDFSSPSYHERVGVWGKSGVFQTYYEESNVTNVLIFNDQDAIVISNGFFGPGDFHSYLVPTPGTRLDLASLVVNLPAGLYLVDAMSIDNQGNITGFASDANYSNFYPFLLQPMKPNEKNPGVGKTHPCSVPDSLQKDFGQKHPQKR